MVGAGVKTLALSSSLSAAEIEALLDDARRIAEENGAGSSGQPTSCSRTSSPPLEGSSQEKPEG
jgi:hypothetical protein